MARVEYTPVRRLAMQAAMGLILLGTVVLASVVDYNIRRAGQVRLGAPITEGDITFRLPEAWAVSPGPGQSPILRTAVEPTGDRPGRILTVIRQRTRVIMSPLEYLDRGGLLRAVAASPGETLHPQRTTVDGWPALLLVGTGASDEVDEDGSPLPPGKLLLLSVVLPTREAVTLKLTGEGPPDDADWALLREVGAGMSLAVHSPPAPGGDASLSNGIGIKAPGDFLVLPESDENTTQRVLLRAPPDASDPQSRGVDPRNDLSWMLVELIPMRVFPGEGPDSILAALATHDSAWLLASVKHESPMRWRIDRANMSEMQFPQAAFLLADPGGEGVLAIVHGTKRDSDQIDAAWQEISTGITFPQPTPGPSTSPAQATPTASDENLPAFLDAGTQLVASIRAGLPDSSAADAAAEQWWQLAYPDAESGWIHLKFTDALNTAESRRRTWDERYSKVVQEWESNPDPTIYKSGIIQQEGDAEYATAFTQVVAQSPMKLSITLTAATGIRLEHDMRPPAQFVGAAELQAAIGRAGTAPLVLRCDRAPLLDAPQLTPVSILINAAAPPAAQEANSAPGADAARCVTAEVNGSGELSRWYYRSDGSLDRIETAGGLRVTRSDAQEIGLLFHDDPMLKPGD